MPLFARVTLASVSLGVPADERSGGRSQDRTRSANKRSPTPSASRDVRNDNDTIASMKTLKYEHEGPSIYKFNKEAILGIWQDYDRSVRTKEAAKIDYRGIINNTIKGLHVLALAQPFPGLEAAVVILDGVFGLEKNRQHNKLAAWMLVLQMADMMSALLQLHFVEGPEEPREGGSIADRIDKLLDGIKNALEGCGNLIERYHLHSRPARFFRADEYKDDFKAKSTELEAQKARIRFACLTYTALGIDGIKKEVHDTNAVVHRLEQELSRRSDDERDWEKFISDNKFGPLKLALKNPNTTQALVDFIEKRGPNKPADGKSKDVKSIDLKLSENEPLFNQMEFSELHKPLEKLLQEGLSSYLTILGAQKDKITEQINWSTLQILKKLNEGPHQRIFAGDIRFVWKEMHWRSSVKNRVFVMGIYEYFQERLLIAETSPAQQSLKGTQPEQQFSILLHQHSQSRTHPQPNIPPTSASDVDETDVASSPITTDDSILADKEYLQYLSTPYVGALSEAMDEDGSGFIRISEINMFCAGKPDNWTLLQWFAYWAQGWTMETAYYCEAFGSLITEMKKASGDVLIENHSLVRGYLEGRGLLVVDFLARCGAKKLSLETQSDSPLAKFVQDQRAAKEARLEAKLRKFGFLIASPWSVSLVRDAGRLEKDVFALFFVVLKRHYRLIKLAKRRVLDEHEFVDSTTTLTSIADAITLQVRSIQDRLRGQRRDIDTEMSRVSGGVYQYLHEEELSEDALEAKLSSSDLSELQEDINSDVSDCSKYPEPLLAADRYNELFPSRRDGKGDVSTADVDLPMNTEGSTEDSLTKEEINKRFVSALAVKMRYPDYEGGWLRPLAHRKETMEEYQKYLDKVDPADVPDLTFLARLEFRGTSVHTHIRCNGCSDLVVGARYKCISCYNLDFCERCADNSSEIGEKEHDVPYKYACSSCKETKTGVRFVGHHKWKPPSSYCPDCESNLTKEINGRPVHPSVRVLMRVILPYPAEDDSGSTICDPEDNTDETEISEEEKTKAKSQEMEERLTRVEESLKSIELRLDQFFRLLDSAL